MSSQLQQQQTKQ